MLRKSWTTTLGYLVGAWLCAVAATPLDPPRIPIDVLFLYTPDARQGAGGPEGIATLADQAIDEANLVFANSRLYVETRVAGLMEIAHQELGNPADDLAQLARGPANPEFDVHQLRDLFEADLVCVVVESGASGGDTYPGPSESKAFIVIRRNGMVGQLVFPQLLGRQLGAGPEAGPNRSPGAASFSHAFGYRTAQGTQATLLYQSAAARRFPVFSNATLEADGVMLGVPAGEPGEADNSRTIQITAPIVASFRGPSFVGSPPAIRFTDVPDSVRTGTPFFAVAEVASESPVRRVDFFLDGQWLATRTEPPYVAEGMTHSPGRHYLSVEAIDSLGRANRRHHPVTAQLANDDFADASLLSGDQVRVWIQINPSAEPPTVEPGETGPYWHSAWFRWAAPSDGFATVGLKNAANSTVSLWTGTSVSNLIPVSVVERGATYWLRLSFHEPYLRLSQIELDLIRSQPEDAFEHRRNLAPTETAIRADNRAASAQPGESLPEGGAGRTLWYEWVAPELGEVAFTPLGQPTPSKIKIYRVTPASGLESLSAEPETTTWVEPGERLAIQLDGDGLVGFDIRFGAPSVGDDWQAAPELPLNGQTFTESTLEATMQLMELEVLQSPAPRSVWRQFEARWDGVFKIRAFPLAGTCGVGLYLHDGSLPRHELASNLLEAEFPHSFFYEVALKKGQRLYLRVGSHPPAVCRVEATFSSLRWEDSAPALEGDEATPFSFTALADPNEGFNRATLLVNGRAGPNVNGPPFVWSGITFPPGRHFVRATATASNNPPVQCHEIELRIRPANDSFSRATPLTGTQVVFSGDASFATLDPWTGSGAGPTAGWAKDVWYRWTAPADGFVQLSSLNSSPSRLIAFTGDSYATLQSVGARFPTRQGQSYWIAADDDAGAFRFQLKLLSPPANDSRAAAQRLSGSEVFIDVSTRGASREPEEPEGSADPTIWFEWTAPAQGLATFSVSPSHTQWPDPAADPRLDFFEAVQGSWQERGEIIGNGKLALSVVPGERLQLRLSSHQSWHFLGVKFEASPRDDRFEGRAALSGSMVNATVDVTAAQTQPEERALVPGMGDRAVWRRWLAPIAGTARLSIRFPLGVSAHPPTLVVFRGDSLAELTPVEQTRDVVPVSANESSINVEFEAEAGVEYQILVEVPTVPAQDGRRTFVLSVTSGNLEIASPAVRRVNVGSDVPLRISTTIPESEIASVHWFRDGYPWLSVSNAPFELVWSNAPLSSFGLKALVKLTSGATRETSAFPFNVGEPNDDFSEAQRVAGWVVELRGDLTGAALEPGEPLGAATTTLGSLWYEWTSPSSGTAWVELVGPSHILSSAARGVRVFTGDSLAHLNPVTALYLYYGEPMPLEVEAGTTYRIAVDHYHPDSGPFVLEIVAPGPSPLLPQDAIVQAIELTGSQASGTSSTERATGEPREPWSPARSVWWKWQAPYDGSVHVDSSRSSVPAQVAIFEQTFESPGLLPVDPTDGGPGNLLLLTSLDSSPSQTANIVADRYYYIGVNAQDDTGGEVAIDLRSSRLHLAQPSVGQQAEVGVPVAVSMGPVEGDVEPPTLVNYWAGGKKVSSSSSPPEFAAVWTPTVDGFLGVSAEAVWANGNRQRVGSALVTVAPANDRFVDRTPITGASAQLSGDLRWASEEPGEPGLKENWAGKSRWWTWTAPSNGILAAKISATPVALAVYAGADLSGLERIAGNWTRLCHPCLSEACLWWGRPELAVDVVAGRTYHLQVSALAKQPGGYHWAPLVDLPVGLFSIELTLLPRPANDDFANRQSLTGSRIVLQASNSGSTREAGEPSVTGIPGSRSVWFSWRAPSAGAVWIGTNPPPAYSTLGVTNLANNWSSSWSGGAPGGTSFDGNIHGPGGTTDCAWTDQYPTPPFQPLLAIYRGDAFDRLTELAVGPDMLVPVAAGEEIHVAVDGAEGTAGEVTCYFAFTSPPPNDDVAKAIPLVGQSLRVTGHNIGATRELGEFWDGFHPEVAGEDRIEARHTVWWKWFSLGEGTVSVDPHGEPPFGGGFRPDLGVFRRDSSGKLQPVRLVEADSFTSFHASAGETYYLSLGQWVQRPVETYVVPQLGELSFDLLGPPPNPQAAGIHLPESGALELRASGVPGQALVIETSDDLLTWDWLVVEAFGEAGESWTIQPGSAPRQFFRIGPLK